MMTAVLSVDSESTSTAAWLASEPSNAKPATSEPQEAARTDMPMTPKGRAVKSRPLRRLGAILGAEDDRLLVWICGRTEDDGEWVDKKYLPATLHESGATFDVWLYDDEPVQQGAYTQQVDPETGEPWSDEELFGVLGTLGIGGEGDHAE